MERPEANRAGLTTYYTGRTCKNGHRHERYTKTGACVICARDAATRDRAAGERHDDRQSWRAGLLLTPEDQAEAREIMDLASARVRAESSNLREPTK
jgi:hypothetical protein